EFQKFLMNGSLYRGSKPVMWSVVEKTALAEAEVEYHDHQSHTIWVKFPIVRLGGVEALIGEEGDAVKLLSLLRSSSIVIWTTTPWTIPANRAISYSPKIAYGLYEVKATGEKLVLADALAEQVREETKIDEWTRLCSVPDSAIEDAVCA